MDPIQDVLWVEKYRPKTLEELALSDENRTLLETYIEAGEIPHLLLLGPAGVGKTTLARILLRVLDCAELRLNASNERGIDTIRDKIGTFVRGRLGRAWNIVFLDEADAMTRDAQTALRNMMESFAGRSRFILTANFGYRIIDPIQSRCVLVELQQLEPEARWNVLCDILEREGIEFDEDIAFTYAESFPDLRRMIMGAQKAILGKGSLVPAHEVTLSGDDLWEAVADQNWNVLREVCKGGLLDHRKALTDLFWAIPEDYPKVAALRAILGHAVRDSVFAPDPVVHFLGTVAECMGEL